MNKKLLQKVIDELNKEKPDLSYVRGMLETLLEIDVPTTQTPWHFTDQNNSSGMIKVDYSKGATSDAERAAMMAESGFIKGTNPGLVTETNVILK